MKRLKPFISYYGSKWRLAPLYPKPTHDTIIEPFAGSACYSLLYPHKKVILNDANPVIAGIWDYLISVSEDEIIRLPVNIETTKGLKIPQEAKWLIGFWFQISARTPISGITPAQKKMAGQSTTWGIRKRNIIASQLKYIRHWKVRCVDYSKLEYDTATWFVDPPYQGQLGSYPYKLKCHTQLGNWCKTRQGQVIVCDQSNADWLPFRELKAHIGQRHGAYVEGMWTNRELFHE